MNETPNHDYDYPEPGEENWGTQLNEMFDAMDVDIEVRDAGPPNPNEYEPVAAAKYLDTDTGLVYLGTGDEWMAMSVLGRTDDPEGVGVRGESTHEEVGNTVGVRGSTASDGDIDEGIFPSGVEGYASGEGPTTGVVGFSEGDTGVYGEGDNVGVVGESQDDIGVRGSALSEGTADTIGVLGTSNADADGGGGINPTGVRGESTGSGITHGVRGSVSSIRGRGVIGLSTSDGYGDALGRFGTGVMGVTDRSGEDGDGDFTEGIGVLGYTIADSGLTFGVIGRNSSSSSGVGVSGYDASDDGGFGAVRATSENGFAFVSIGEVGISGSTTPAEITFFHYDDDGEFAGETTQRTAGPIAKGFVSDTSLENAVHLSEVTWNESESRYEITIEGEDFAVSEYATSVSPTDPVAHKVDSTDDSNLVVRFADDDQHDFQLVVHKLQEEPAPDTDSETAEISQRQGQRQVHPREIGANNEWR